MENNYGSKKILIYKWKKTYKAGDTILIETDSKKYLDKARKEYALRRKNKKTKK